VTHLVVCMRQLASPAFVPDLRNGERLGARLDAELLHLRVRDASMREQHRLPRVNAEAREPHASGEEPLLHLLALGDR